MNILWTGDRGFIAGYAIQKLIDRGYKVVGIDNDWKYCAVERTFDFHPNYSHYRGDAKDVESLSHILFDHQIDVFVMGAAIIGGISMFNSEAYSLLAENERLNASAFDAAIYAHASGNLKHVVAISSSMVYETATRFPSQEGDEFQIPPPITTYGFQKLAVEYFCRGAWQQHKLPYKIVLPFNCVGTGEIRAKNDKEIMSGNIKLAMSHVVPDLINKIYKGQHPLHVLGTGEQVRHYTYADDIAEGILKIIESDKAMFESFNISTPEGIQVKDLAFIIKKKICSYLHREFEPLEIVLDPGYEHDVQNRVPDTTKAKVYLGFEAKTSLDGALDILIPWYIDAIDKGLI
jgi:nucleoside-diphosphate-sugar epimerase